MNENAIKTLTDKRSGNSVKQTEKGSEDGKIVQLVDRGNSIWIQFTNIECG